MQICLRTFRGPFFHTFQRPVRRCISHETISRSSDYTFTIYPGHGKMPRTFEPTALLGSWVRFHRWSNRFRPGLKIRFTVAFLSGRHFEQFISASRGVRRSFLISPFPSLFPRYFFSTLFAHTWSVKTRCFRVATRRISHVSIAQRFTVLSASFPPDFYTAGATTPRPSFPSIHPLLARFFPSRAYFVNHPAKFAPEQDVYGCQLIGSKCSKDICPIFSFFFSSLNI